MSRFASNDAQNYLRASTKERENQVSSSLKSVVEPKIPDLPYQLVVRHSLHPISFGFELSKTISTLFHFVCLMKYFMEYDIFYSFICIFAREY